VRSDEVDEVERTTTAVFEKTSRPCSDEVLKSEVVFG
jgi:hypothetical protein